MRLGCRGLCTPCCGSTRRRVFVVEATDGGGVAFYAITGVSSKEGELTPPFARLRTTHQLVSPQRIHAEDDTNSLELIKGKRGWRRRVQLIALSQFRRYGVRCGCCGSCRKQGWMWAAKRHVSPAWVVVERERDCGRRNNMFRRLSKGPVVTKNEFGVLQNRNCGKCRHFDTFRDALRGSPLSFSYLSTSTHIPR